ncbi:amino acid ABC transporter permease [Caballeronia sp. J97]|uniref:amino acid ABC transporter permease n=1 Tax=Caballeronia sp. J97 TaxID=2805429 RepID=UPI002AAF74D0|nr:amino acid ABC transporter permease [Caballeronia sp. J97]
MEPFGYHAFIFLLMGLKWTLLLTAISFVGGGVVGLLVALARTSKWHALRVITSAYIALFQGTPLLMQLFVVYYGVALLQINIEPWLAVTFAFTAHASAFLGDIWRGSIQALPKGQTEAAQALGIPYISRIRHVILPQALKISLPATIGFAVQLLKGTSLAAIVGFIELARAGQIISNQTFQPILVFGIVGCLFFAVCWPLSHYGSRLERRLAVGTAGPR